MTPNQLLRRRRLTDAVIQLVAESGPDNVQMRDVAERSGVALGTMYRYFASKDHLLAAALADWQHQLTDRVMAGLAKQGARSDGGLGNSPCERVLAFLHRALRAFQGNPNFARLLVHIESSLDPFASETLVEQGRDSNRVMRALMAGVSDEIAETAIVAIDSTFAAGLVEWITGRLTITDLFRRVDDVTRLVLSDHSGAPQDP